MSLPFRGAESPESSPEFQRVPIQMSCCIFIVLVKSEEFSFSSYFEYMISIASSFGRIQEVEVHESASSWKYQFFSRYVKRI